MSFEGEEIKPLTECLPLHKKKSEDHFEDSSVTRRQNNLFNM